MCVTRSPFWSEMIQDYAAELAYLKQKVDAGADFITTQASAHPHVHCNIPPYTSPQPAPL